MEITLGNTIGAGFLGTIAASILFGVTVVQAYFYYLHYPKDRRFQKIAVGVLLALDTVHLALTVHAMYSYVIEGFGDLLGLEVVVWSFKLQIAVNVVIVLLVQSLYAVRVWKLGMHLSSFWPWIVIVVVAGGYAVGIRGFLLVLKTYQIKTFAELKGMSSVVYASFSTSTAIDIVIASVICYYLMSNRSSFMSTTNVIVRIMHYTLVSGFLTSACSLSALITYSTMPSTLVFLGIEFLLTKLYINSYVAMLNARKVTRDSSNFNVSDLVNMEMGPGSTTFGDKDTVQFSPISYEGGRLSYKYPTPTNSPLVEKREEMVNGFQVREPHAEERPHEESNPYLEGQIGET